MTNYKISKQIVFQGLIFLSLFLLTSNALSLEWDNSKGPYGGDRKEVVIDYHTPNILFVSSVDRSGVWISKNAGQSWQHTLLNRGSTNIAGSHFDYWDDGFDKTYIYAVRPDEPGNIYRLIYSKNFSQGSNEEDPQLKEWDRIQFDPAVTATPTEIYTDPQRPARVFVLADNNSKIFYSLNYANNWAQLDLSDFPGNSSKDFTIAQFAADPEKNTRIFLLVYYTDDHNLYKGALMSCDLAKIFGQRWKIISKGLAGANSEGEFTGTFNNRIITSFAFPKNNTDTLYLSLKWDKTLRPNQPYSIAKGTKYTDCTYAWVYKTISNISYPSLYGLAVSPHNPNALLLGINKTMEPEIDGQHHLIRGLYKSRDGASTWKKVASSDYQYMTYLKGNKSFAFHPYDKNTVYASCTNFDAVRKSIDEGEIWFPAVTSLSGINVFGVAVTDSNIYGVVQAAIAINTESLSSDAWNHRQITDPEGLPTANLFGGVEVDPFDETNVLVGAGHKADYLSHNAGIFKHNDSGLSSSPTDWQRVLYDSDPNDNKDNPQIMDILFSETTPGLVLAAAMKDKTKINLELCEQGLYISYNHGQDWSWFYQDSDMYYIVQDPYQNSVYYFVGQDKTETGGAIIKVKEDYPGFNYSGTISLLNNDYFYSIDIQKNLDIDSAYAFLGTENGLVYRIPLLKLRESKFTDLELVHTFPEATSTIVAADPNRPYIIYAGAFNGGVYRSIDSGLTWQEYSQGLESSGQDIYEIKFSPDGNRIYAGTLGSIAINDNQPPFFTSTIADQVIDEGETLTLSVSGEDPEQDPVNFFLQDNPDFVSLAANGDNTAAIIISPDHADARDEPYHIIVQLSDGLLNEVMVFNLTVNNINRAPAADSQNISTDEDTPITITLTATDADGDTLTYSIVTQPGNGILSGTAPNLTYTPNANYNGSDSFTFKANDGELDSNIATVSITINPVNDAPLLNPIGDKTVDEGKHLEFTVSASDVDGDALTITAARLEPWMSFDETTFTAEPGYEEAGTYNITFTASDGSLTDEETITITVTDVNRPPVLAPIGDKTTDEGQLLSFTVSATDPEGDDLIFSASNLPEGASFNPLTQVFTWTPDYSQAGIYTGIHFQVSDGALTDSEDITITVNNVPNPPAAPSQLTAQAVSSSQINLTWQDNSDNEVGFRLWRREGQTEEVILIATLEADTTSYQDTGLKANTVYYYIMKAFNEDGSSAFSNYAKARTKK